jgi:hypothetical protein
MSSKSSLRSEKNPYEKASFWLDPSNHFWERDLYSQKAKDYYRAFIESIRQDTKALSAIDNTLK